MNLIIDIGNSTSKLAIIDDSASVIVKNGKYENPVSPDIIRTFTENHCIKQAILCSVRDVPTEFVEFLKKTFSNFILFSHDTPIPLKNDYATPATLGLDRLAAAIGATVRYPGQHFLIVDFGSAITIDIVSDGAFKGGNISPGASLRFKALHEYTDRLPLCSLPATFNELGTSTRSAIENGVVCSIVHEIAYYITHFRNKYSNLNIIFTGGDGKYFAKKLKKPIFVNCELVIWGLNEVLKHNHAFKEKP